MKLASILVSILAMGFGAHAADPSEPSKNEVLVDGMALVGTQQASFPEPEVRRSLWNLNLGLSQMDRNYDSGSSSQKGSGLTVELQRRLADRFYLGGSYTNYKADLKSDSGNFFASSSSTYIDVFTLSLEAQMIRLPMGGKTEFFTALNGGFITAVAEGQVRESRSPSFYYGAGIGVNFRHQLGLRADLKSSRDFSVLNSVSLVGYY